MISNLIIPRVRVLWGGEDITFYKPSAEWLDSATFAEPQPLVYDVNVSLQEEGQVPRGSMKWNPTGKAFAEYENKFLKDKIKDPIQVQFYYVNGRSIVFQFVWAGHQISYGNNLEIQITLGCELDGLVNGNARSTAHAKEEGIPFKAGNSKIAEQFNVPDSTILYTEQSSKDTGKNKFESTYGENVTFFEKIQQLNQANGNMVMASNIDSPGQCVIFTPYSWEKSPKVEEPTPTQAVWPVNKRFGYFLGPSLINAMVRTSEWQKPQQSQTANSSRTNPVRPSDQNQYQTQNPTSAGQNATTGAGSKPTTSPQGPQRGRSSPNTKSKENPDGPPKQDAMKKERGSKIAINTFLVPALVGIKPQDILLIPNFKGDYMEDWIVTGVEYQQNDGNVEVSIQGARTYGLGSLMNEPLSKHFLDIAKAKKLVGEGATLEAWEEYAWPPNLRGAAAAPPSSSTPAAAAPPAGASVLSQQAQELRDMQAASRARQVI